MTPRICRNGSEKEWLPMLFATTRLRLREPQKQRRKLMPEIVDQFVDYFIYCPTCKHKEKNGWDDPCNECMETPVRKNTTKPAMYEKENKS
jgi:hypothetical protein